MPHHVGKIEVLVHQENRPCLASLCTCRPFLTASLYFTANERMHQTSYKMGRHRCALVEARFMGPTDDNQNSLQLCHFLPLGIGSGSTDCPPRIKTFSTNERKSGKNWR